MDRNNISDEQYYALLDSIFPILAEKGPCATTMDLVAHKLGMSKRTLYEIFDSKDHLLASLMDRLRDLYSDRIQKILRSAENIMEGIANVFLFHQGMMRRINARFFRDMDTRFPHLRRKYESESKHAFEQMLMGCSLGVRQGVFRDDVNYEIIIRLFRIQMESLKRMEEFFPKDISLVEAYNAISLGMLRSIATPKGMEVIDGIAGRFQPTSEPYKEELTSLFKNPNDNK